MPEAERELTVLLLGPPQIFWQGKSFDLKGRQNRLLVYYLAASQKLVERRSLADLIWPMEEQTDIGRQLRQALSRLRRDLPDRCLLVENRDQIGLDWTRVYCDIAEFENLLPICLRQVENEQRTFPISKPAIVETMHQAVGLWRGTKLVEGFNLSGSPKLEDWFIYLEHRLESGRRWLLERLSDHESASHRPLEALKLAQAALKGNELDENLHERVLNLLLRSGQRSQAKRHYTFMKKGFASAGLEPNQALQMLAAQLESRIDEQGTAVVRRRSTSKRQPLPERTLPGDVPWNVFHPGDEPFIGRMMILDSLMQIAQVGGAVLIQGESGQGKTRLLKEFYAHLSPPPRLILAAGQPGESSLPFQPLITALTRQVSPAEWLQLPTTWASYLTLLFPELSAKRANLRIPNLENKELVRAHLFRALSELFTLLAERQPDKRLVLILDDAHWADESTLQALGFLHNHAPFNQRSLIVLAARIEEPNSALEAFASDLGKNERFKKLRMNNLSEQAIAQLARHFIRADSPPKFVRQLARASGGNPLYLIEIMRGWLQDANSFTKLALSTPNNQLPMPEQLLELMKYRLTRLPPDARRLIETIAIFGEEINQHRLNRLAAQTNWPTIFAAMDHLIQSGLIIKGEDKLTNPDSQSIGTRYGFVHDKFREATLLSIPAVQQSVLHRQAATILEEEFGHHVNDQAAMIAQHHEAGGNLPAAVHYWTWAAHQSVRLSAMETAQQQYKHADSLVESCFTDVSDNDLFFLYTWWENFLNNLNDAGGIEALSELLINRGTHYNNLMLIGMGQYMKAAAAFTRNDIETGLALIEEYQGYLEVAGQPNALAKILALKGTLHIMIGQITASLEYLQRSMEILKPLAVEDEFSAEQARACQYEICIAEIFGGNPIAGYEHAIMALNAFETMGTPTVTSLCHSAVALSSYFSGEFNRALLHCRQGLDLAFSNNSLRGIGYLNLYFGLILAAQGDLDSCLANVQIAEEFGRRSDRREIYSHASRIRGDILSDLGEYRQAAALQHKAYTENSDLFATMDYQIRAAINELKMMDDLYSPECQQMAKYIQDLKVEARLRGLNLVIHYAAQWEMIYHARRQEWAALKAVIDSETPVLIENGLLPMLYDTEFSRAQMEAAEGHPEQAMARLDEVAAWAKQSGHIWLEIGALREKIRINHHLKQSPQAALTARMMKLLSTLQEHSQHEMVREPVQQFCIRIMGELVATP